jgi:hypothetical protein
MAHLLRDQVVELPYRESAGFQQFHAIPLVSGSMHERLHIREPVAECSSYSEDAALERKEADDLVALLQDRESHV